MRSSTRITDRTKASMENFVTAYPVPEAVREDRFAAAVSWKPLLPGGSNVTTHKLEYVSEELVAFASTIGARLFTLAFAGIGGLVFLMGLVLLNSANNFFPAIMMTSFGALFAIVGIWMFFRFDEAIMFDKERGLYWKANKPPRLDRKTIKRSNCCHLEDIAGIQLLEERVRSGQTSFFSYELNLVLADGNRLQVIDHSNLDQIRMDAATLGTFLDVPVWDGI